MLNDNASLFAKRATRIDHCNMYIHIHCRKPWKTMRLFVFEGTSFRRRRNVPSFQFIFLCISHFILNRFNSRQCSIFSGVQFSFFCSFVCFFFFLYCHWCVSYRGDSASSTSYELVCHKVQSGELAYDVLRKNDLIRMFRFGRIAFGGAVPGIKRRPTQFRENWVIDPPV